MVRAIPRLLPGSRPGCGPRPGACSSARRTSCLLTARGAVSTCGLTICILSPQRGEEDLLDLLDVEPHFGRGRLWIPTTDRVKDPAVAVQRLPGTSGSLQRAGPAVFEKIHHHIDDPQNHLVLRSG